MDVSEFLRLFEARRGQVMFFLGAGASATAGIPTADDLTWRFKRKIYCSDERIPISRCRDLANPVVRRRLQDHFEGRDKFSPRGSPEEYAVYFEAAYPSAKDRRRIIDDYTRTADPSYGHRVLAALLDEGIVRVVWTTNFDRLVEDAAGSPLPSGKRLTVVDIERSDQFMEAMNEERWPILGKLHGDFQSRRLKNIRAELQEQDSALRDALVEAGKRYGLAVIGYSGRDESVMRALGSVAEDSNGFPGGLFWFHYGDSEPLPAVRKVLEKARSNGIEAEMISGGGFDELLGDVAGMFPAVHEELSSRAEEARPRKSRAPIPSPGSSWPVVRLNAYPVVERPTVARKIQCDIGGVREVREAIEEAGVDVVATRRRHGVLAFGADDDIRHVFEPYNISEFDIEKIDPGNSLELGLLSDSLSHAFGRERPVNYVQAGVRAFLHVERDRTDNEGYERLRNAVGEIFGKVPKTSLKWWEAVELHLQFRDGRLWLVVDPTIFHDFTADQSDRKRAKKFVAQRQAARYNDVWNQLYDAWTAILYGGRKDECELRTFGIGDGMDARFVVSGKTAFSRRSA